MSRIENWPTRIVELVAEAEGKRFAWGSHDCATFAAGIEKAITGATRFSDTLGKYSTASGSRMMLRARGFENVEELVAARLPEIERNFAQRGDVVTVDTENGPALGIVLGEVAVSPGPDGLVRYPMTAARRAFRVA